MTKKIKLFTYFPFFGWMIALVLNKDDTFIIQHVKQGIVLAFFFVSVQIFSIFSTVFVPNSYRKLKFGIVVFIYVMYALYLLLCLIGTMWVKNGVGKEFPIVKRFTKNINI